MSSQNLFLSIPVMGAIGMVLGISAGAAFWYGYELPHRATQEAFYLKLEKAKLEAAQQ